MRFPAGRAGLCLSLSITTCGITNFPVLDTSLVAMPDSVVNTLLTSLAFCPVFEEMAAISAPPVMALAPFMAFIAFMALAIVLQSITAGGQEGGAWCPAR